MLNRPPALPAGATDLLDFLISDLRRYHESVTAQAARLSLDGAGRVYLAEVADAIAELHNDLLEDPDEDGIG